MGQRGSEISAPVGQASVGWGPMRRATVGRFTARARSAAIGIGLAVVALPAFAHETERETLARAAATEHRGSVQASNLAQSSGSRIAPTISFDIPAQPLRTALLAFGRQAGLQVTVESVATAGKQARAVVGSFTAEEALQRLLAGTDLTWRYVDADTVALERAVGREDGGPVRLNSITVEGKAESAYGPVDGYKASRSATATKTDTPIIDTPAAIQVIPRQVIEDQGARRLADVVRNTSSVQASSANGGRSDLFLIRGFAANRIARDGFLSASSFGDAAQLGLANVERVEVLKGPPSVLYGPADPGGLVNIVTKKPQPEPRYSLTGRAGSFDFYKSDVDFNQPLTEDGKLLARLNASYENADSFRDHFINSERIQVAPSLRWVPMSRTTVDFDLEYYERDHQTDYGVIAVDGKAPALPRERFLGEERDRTESDEIRLQASVDHEFNDDWSLRTLARFSDTSARSKQSFPFGLAADGRTFNRRFFDFDQDFQNYALQANLTGNFETGPLEHQLLFGADGNFTRFESIAYSADLDPIDILDPVYGAGLGTRSAPGTQDRRVDFYGLYLQDLISFGDHWKLLLGGRYDTAKTQFDRNGASITDKWDQAFSPRAGLVFQPIDDLSLYASYTTSFLPPLSGASFDGEAFEPEEGEQFEVGVKRDWFDGRLSTTLAAFQLTRSNVSTIDPQNPGFSIQVGEQRSRGVELDIAGELASGWSMIGSLAYLDTEVTKDNALPVGNRLINAPEWSGSLWTAYAFQDKPLRGLEIGGGVFVVGDRKADFDNRVDVDGYVRVDLFARYEINDTISLALNVDNLFDENYIEGVDDPNFMDPGAPRSVFGTVQIKF